jgi:peroxiredoxin
MRFASITLAAALSVSAFASSAVTGQRAPELTITEPSGAQTLLSSYRGKAVIVAFIKTTCPHCQQFCLMLSRLQKEYGPQGLQVLGVASFDTNSPQDVRNFVKQLNLNFPVGCSFGAQSFYSYFGYSETDRVLVPQAIAVGRNGVLRQRSPVGGAEEFQDETKLRALIQNLLKEPAAKSH